MINASLFTAQSGNYTPITSAITADDAQVFVDIYTAIEAHATSTGETLQDYIAEGVCVNLGIENIASIATLKTVGVIVSSDNIHIGLTPLGYGFYQFIQA